MASTFGFALKVTGGADFQAQLKNATQSIKTATSELSKIDSQYGKTDNSATKLTEKNKALKNATRTSALTIKFSCLKFKFSIRMIRSIRSSNKRIGSSFSNLITDYLTFSTGIS